MNESCIPSDKHAENSHMLLHAVVFTIKLQHSLGMQLLCEAARTLTGSKWSDLVWCMHPVDSVIKHDEPQQTNKATGREYRL